MHIFDTWHSVIILFHRLIYRLRRPYAVSKKFLIVLLLFLLLWVLSVVVDIRFVMIKAQLLLLTSSRGLRASVREEFIVRRLLIICVKALLRLVHDAELIAIHRRHLKLTILLKKFSIYWASTGFGWFDCRGFCKTQISSWTIFLICQVDYFSTLFKYYWSMLFF